MGWKLSDIVAVDQLKAEPSLKYIVIHPVAMEL